MMEPLDRKITLQSLAVTRDDWGGAIETWSDFAANIWARFRDLGGKESFAAKQAGSSINREVVIRWRSDVTPAMRVKFADNTTARIEHIKSLDRDKYMILYVERVDG